MLKCIILSMLSHNYCVILHNFLEVWAIERCRVLSDTYTGLFLLN